MDDAESSSAGSAGSSSSSGSSCSSASSFFFPAAAQPEVMRAAEKDEHYVASLCDACHEAFRHAMGKWMLHRLHFCFVVGLGTRICGRIEGDPSGMVVGVRCGRVCCHCM